MNVAGTGTLTNLATGTLEAQAGSTLHVSDTFSATNFSGGELSNGTYEALGGNTVPTAATIQIDSLGTGGEIIKNAATVVLSGADASIADKSNLNALTNFQDNLASGNFTVENGQEFVTTANGTNFENDGSMDVGGGSGFTTANDYNQGGGTTLVDGTLTATGGQVNINGGTLIGTGTVVGTVNIGSLGAITPDAGDPNPGQINIIGSYNQSGTLNEEIGGTPNSGAFSSINATDLRISPVPPSISRWSMASRLALMPCTNT